MKKVILICCAALFTHHGILAQDKLDLNPSQSMCITGKGIGQDGANNPYYGQNCYAIVENIGDKAFSIRTQQNGKIIDTIPIKKGEIKKVKLLIGHELYFDTSAKNKARAKVEFEKINK